MFDTEDVGVFLGLDVGKTAHHGHGLTPAGKKVLDKQLPNSEPKLRAVFDKLTAKFGTVLVVVDQPASIGALPLTVARDASCKVAYLPGLAMRRIADLYPGEAKTDAKDAAVIADAARTMPHTLRSLELTDEITAELTVLVGFDQGLAAEATRTSNRIRGLLTQFHPGLERVLGPRLDHPAVTWLLERHGSPAALRKAGRRRLVEVIRPKAPRMAARLIDDRRPRRADRRGPGDRHSRRRDPLPGPFARGRPRTAPGPGSPDQSPAGGPPSFPGPDLDAGGRGQDRRSAAGHRRRRHQLPRRRPPRLLRRPRPSHQVVRDLDPRRTRTPQRKPPAQTGHVPLGLRRPARPRLPHLLRQCRARGKTHTQALLRLARHRISVLFAMLRDGTFYEPRLPQATAV
jgi:hypothetical protein